MIQISELLRLPLFSDFELFACEEGLENSLSNIVILEYESINHNYEVFNKGDFVLTSLFFAKECPALIEEAIKELIKRQISGIAIKTVFFKELPVRVKELATNNHIPLFFFHDAYMEDLIISANELLKSKLQYLVSEEKVTGLIQAVPSRHQASNIAKEINPAFRPQIFSAYLTSRNPSTSNDISAYFQRILYKRYRSSRTYAYSYVKYRQGMLILLSYDHAPEDLLNEIYTQLKAIDLSPDHFYIGIADQKTTLRDFDISMKQAIYSNRICQLEQNAYQCYSQTGVYQFIAPLLDQITIKENYENYIQLLKDYDIKFTSSLLDTLELYIRNNGEIQKTANAVYQHSNTVRYRIKKACSLLNCKEEGFYNFALILIKIYLLEKNSTI